MCLCVYVWSMFAFVGRLCGFVGVCVRVREGEHAVMCQYDSSVFILFFPINITPSPRSGACGFQEIVHAERRKIGSVRICGERIYGERSNNMRLCVKERGVRMKHWVKKKVKACVYSFCNLLLSGLLLSFHPSSLSLYYNCTTRPQ